mmetsp:Transcript_10961/g.19812  ORF Transcript_10961/g.19812 Transcript_10961/m.19812 type:complete len:377 (-) Transcript_10961:99-1229(-)|eukprot:CAMPEP_0182445290 /NCGR_PEP_ID=MMETSP1172-20130603/3463_1 /TAXON_ID=708627 /ORGANISM="Timspurckia oligopyrenoides, Strain CCMP3278" /LENGTH=376 /DNA_ID=CAMNT_0024641027 /DNA_START=28 /DNA_END=1158 /DNA_ORIENTATION=+
MEGEIEKISEFAALTGADVSSARFYLESCGWDLNSAAAAFFEAGSAPGSAPSDDTPSAPAAVKTSQREASQPSVRAAAASSSTRRAGFATISDIQEPEDEDAPQNYYAGGEKSGQMIQDPRKKEKPSGDALPQSILDRARQMAAEMDAERERAQESGDRFAGAGYRLGDQEGPSGDASESVPVVRGKRMITKRLVFYSNGFVIQDQGTLRRYDDPANADFLKDINRGFVPREMESDAMSEVDIELENRRNEEFVPPKPALVPFSGSGQKLGDHAAPVAAQSAPISVNSAVSPPKVDESRPISSIQVRLSDGTRLVARLNEDSTIGDLRSFVNAARPGFASVAYDLSTTFPKKVLSDNSATISSEGLKGAVVVQTMR